MLARELSRNGFSVVVLEQGPWLTTKDFTHDGFLNWNHAALTNDFRKQPTTFRKTPKDKAVKQPALVYGRLVGGGPVHFTANYWRFHEIDFIEASKKGTIPGTGFADWPINIEELADWSGKMLAKMRTLPQLADAATDLLNSAPQLTVTINRDHASRFGITPQLIDDTLNDAFGQRQVTQYYTQINTYWIILEVKPELRGLPSTLDRIYVKSPLTGGAVPLSRSSASTARRSDRWSSTIRASSQR